MGPNQTNKLLHSKGNQRENPKRQPNEWEKIVSNNAPDKGLISKNIQTTLYNSTAEKEKKVEKMSKRPK